MLIVYFRIVEIEWKHRHMTCIDTMNHIGKWITLIVWQARLYVNRTAATTTKTFATIFIDDIRSSTITYDEPNQFNANRFQNSRAQFSILRLHFGSSLFWNAEMGADRVCYRPLVHHPAGGTHINCSNYIDFPALQSERERNIFFCKRHLLRSLTVLYLVSIVMSTAHGYTFLNVWLNIMRGRRRTIDGWLTLADWLDDDVYGWYTWTNAPFLIFCLLSCVQIQIIRVLSAAETYAWHSL